MMVAATVCGDSRTSDDEHTRPAGFNWSNWNIADEPDDAEDGSEDVQGYELNSRFILAIERLKASPALERLVKLTEALADAAYAEVTDSPTLFAGVVAGTHARTRGNLPAPIGYRWSLQYC